MVYEQKKMKEKPVPKAGTQATGDVTLINSGKFKDFVDEKILETWENAEPEGTAIQIIISTADGFEFETTMSYNEDYNVHPTSKMAKWKKAFGEYPFEKQKVFLVADGKGFWNLPF